MREQRLHVAFFDYASGLEHEHAIAQMAHDIGIMRDEEQRGGMPCLRPV